MPDDDTLGTVVICPGCKARVYWLSDYFAKDRCGKRELQAELDRGRTTQANVPLSQANVSLCCCEGKIAR